MGNTAKEGACGAGKIQLCAFWLAGRLFGVNIMDVKEINTEINFTAIHHAPPQICGYVNIRGQIHLVVDLRLLLGFEPAEVSESSRVVIFKSTVAEPFGTLVDKIGDIIEVSPEQLEDYNSHDESSILQGELWKSKRLVQGVCKLDKSLLVVLNARSILGAITEGANTQ